MGRKIKRKDLKYGKKKYTYDFQLQERIKSFGESIYIRKAGIVEAEEDQSNLLKNILESDKKSRPKRKEGQAKKKILMKMHMLFVKGNN